MKKSLGRVAVSVILILGILVGLVSFTACGEDHTERDAEIVRDAEALINKAYRFNTWFFIEGLPLLEGGNVVNGYSEVDMTALAAYGYGNISEILTDMRSVWSETYCLGLEKTSLFEGVTTGSAFEPCYCMDRYHYQTKEYEGIYAIRDGLPTVTDYVVYDTSTLAVLSAGDLYAEVSVDVTVTDKNDPDKSQVRTVTLTLVKDMVDGAAWRLNSSIAVKYFEKKIEDIVVPVT